jgi:hypothetical protein
MNAVRVEPAQRGVDETLYCVMIVLAYLVGVASPYIVPNVIGWALFGSGHEMSRKTSPDGVLDAVVIENDPGAMSSFIYYLYLVPKGEKVSSHRDPYIVNTSEGEELKTNWQKPHFLVDATSLGK